MIWLIHIDEQYFVIILHNNFEFMIKICFDYRSLQ